MSTLMSKKYFPVVLVLIIIVVALVVFAGRSGGNVSLEARTDKDSYAPGEPITLTLTLTNTGTDAVCLSETPDGGVQLTSVTVDGADVRERKTEASYITSLSDIIASKLRSIAPGETMEITLTSEIDAGLGSEAFYHTELDDISGILEFYDVGAPGIYRIEVSYDYQGKESDTCPDILKGSTNTATVSFTVTQ